MKTSEKIKRGVKKGCACFAEYIEECNYICKNCPMYDEEGLEGTNCILRMTVQNDDEPCEGPELEIALAFELTGD